ncbi:hypothetical protein UFOVP185_6 [uncultured Caudovirales phage]|uniref:Uncharacterized protein n=1 Tax=uncultured Caudovirales phage TaxID=2100421 RepID=A0A6J7WFZ0_9CAUD|nr:hypothetical protein UFOVP185_6 [uncultured Caudovirales phage]
MAEVKKKSTVSKKVGPCKSCKNKKPITELPPIVDENVYVPSLQEIKEAYVELSNMKGVHESKREMINKVYSFIFQEDFDFNCSGCMTIQGRKFHNYVVDKLKIEL